MLTLSLNGNVIHECSEDGSITVGRDIRNDVVLRHLTVSRMHAHILHDGYFWVVYDDGALNGVRVNGEKIPHMGVAVLHDGDTVSFGDVVLNVHTPAVCLAAV